jgi:hypothetical protein
MNADEKCPICKETALVEGKGQLDQCEMTVLECKTVECPNGCYKEFQPIKGAKSIVIKRK